MRFLLKRDGFYFIVHSKNYFGERNSGNAAELKNTLPGPTSAWVLKRGSSKCHIYMGNPPGLWETFTFLAAGIYTITAR